MKNYIEYTNQDYEAIKILEDFLPDKMFDSHAHLFDMSFLPKTDVDFQDRTLKAGIEEYKKAMIPMLCNPEKLRLNIITYPDATMSEKGSQTLKASDEFLVEQLCLSPESVGEIIVTPHESADDIKKRLVHPNIRGFKCYHVMSDEKPTWNNSVDKYLPEAAWQVANEKKMCITLHMVKDKALADKENLDYICTMAERYPDATLILAHAARSFASWTGVESVEKVAHLENVWFDFSAVCESPAMFQIMRKAGVSRCMWGSDFPVCADKGKAISLGDAFYWIYENDLNIFSSKTILRSWHIGIENLMATRQACILAELSRNEIEDLFYNNAARLWK